MRKYFDNRKCNSGLGLKQSDVQISQARDQDPNHMMLSCNKSMHERKNFRACSEMIEC